MPPYALRDECTEVESLQEKKSKRKSLNCDQVSWLMNALERFAQASSQQVPMVSRLPKTAKLATLLEIMEVLGYEFEDKSAAGNALSPFWEFNQMRGLDESC